MTGFALPGLATRAITISRYSAGSYVNGRWQGDGSPTTVDRVASVQPGNGKDLEQLPEGDRTKEVIKVYVDYELRSADQGNGIEPDQILDRGETYEVKRVHSYTANGVYMYTRALAVKVYND